MITANRYHDFSAGHRVFGHESKCAHLHGHNYRVHFSIQPFGDGSLDDIGRVLDFSVIKTTLCDWLEKNWDHKMLIWEKDKQFVEALTLLDPAGLVVVPFNPTAENMAVHLMYVVAPEILPDEVRLCKVTIEETRKCSVTYEG